MLSICPNCQHETELILTAEEEREARADGWYVSCPKCLASYAAKFEANDNGKSDGSS